VKEQGNMMGLDPESPTPPTSKCGDIADVSYRDD